MQFSFNAKAIAFFSSTFLCVIQFILEDILIIAYLFDSFNLIFSKTNTQHLLGYRRTHSLAPSLQNLVICNWMSCGCKGTRNWAGLFQRSLGYLQIIWETFVYPKHPWKEQSQMKSILFLVCGVFTSTRRDLVERSVPTLRSLKNWKIWSWATTNSPARYQRIGVQWPTLKILN